jgi:hypothetical protein
VKQKLFIVNQISAPAMARTRLIVTLPFCKMGGNSGGAFPSDGDT